MLGHLGEHLLPLVLFSTIDDPVFDHSSISHFIDRIGRDGFAAIFDGLNDELLRLGMLSPEMYVDASLVKANVSGYDLAPSGLTVAEFKEQAIEENGLFVLTTTTVDDDGIEHENVRHFQSPEGRMPLNPVDTDARWKTTRAGKASGLQYQENVIVDLGGFILSRGVTHASERESKAVAGLLEGLPLQPVSLAGDTGYSDGRLRHLLEEQDITAYIPIHPKQETSMVASGDFVYHGDHLVCPQGKILRRSTYHKRQRSYQYVARQKDCQACPIKDICLPPGQKRRFFGVTIYHPEYARARERNRTAAYRRESVRRKTIAEGTFASLDRLGWEKSRLRGLWKVDCEGYMAALAHNVLKMVRKLGRGVGPPGPVAPADAIAANAGHATDDAVANFVMRSSWFGWLTWWTQHLKPVPR